MTPTAWQPDPAALLLRLARRLEDDGVTHPVEAAVALTVRGRRGLSRTAFARELGVDDLAVARAEAGEVRVGQWPEALWHEVEHELPEAATLLTPARRHPAGRRRDAAGSSS